MNMTESEDQGEFIVMKIWYAREKEMISQD